MLQNLLAFYEKLKNKQDSLVDKRFYKTICDFHLFIFENIIDNEIEIDTLFENIKESQVIMINHIKETNQMAENLFFVICFKDSLLILHQSSLNFLHTLFTLNSSLRICYMYKTKEYFQNESIQCKEILTDLNFETEIRNLSNHFILFTTDKTIKDIWPIISQTISGYLIKKSYFQISYNRIQNFISNEEEKSSIPENINEDEYVELRRLGNGSIFAVCLFYHIEKGELRAIKKPNLFDEDISKLMEREMHNYLKIRNPFLPKFYGKIQGKNDLVIEFINGKTFDHLSEFNFDYKDIITIIFEILLIVEYLHCNYFIIRDLKLDNMMLDDEKTVVMIDFDRMVEIGKNPIYINFTANISNSFSAPEVNESGNFSYKSDIYSIGKIIEHILEVTTKPNEENIYMKINEICQKCTKTNPKERPFILEVVREYFLYFYKDIKIEHISEIYSELLDDNFKNNVIQTIINYNYKLNLIQKGKADYYSAVKLFNLALYYYNGENNAQHDINKAIYYFTLSADLNYSKSQVNLGLFYKDGEGVMQDINKSIHYFSLAAKQNNPLGHLNLGIIYYEGELVPRDINKAIYHFSCSAELNNPFAQEYLGEVYSSNRYVKRDITKAIHYYTLASNQGSKSSQFMLGLIYDKFEQINRDVKKAIYYYTLAANQNYQQAQYRLGLIYLEKEFSDINKAIFYFKLAAAQDHPESQLILGFLFHIALYIKRDMNKAIHYYSLAARHNISHAQFYLGVIYYEGK